ncbi:MAG: tyrosine-type recombinase/integrase [Desulfurivibrionaceae bacterium]
MPFKRTRNGKTKFIGQCRKKDRKIERVFLTRREAIHWEEAMRNLPEEEWLGTTSTTCLISWAEAYLDHAKEMFSKKTYEEKQAMFRRFFKRVDPQLNVAELSPAIVLGFLQEQKKSRSGCGANKDRKNLVSAYNWGMRYYGSALPSPNPCLVMKMPEIRKPRYIPQEEDFWKVYNVAEGQDKVMLLAFIHLAARRGELFRLKIEDLDFDSRRVRLWTRKRGNGNYESDWLPMTDGLREALLGWLANRPIKDDPHVFLCLDKTHFCQEYYGKPFKLRAHLMSNLCDKAGIEKPFGFHSIRHLTATILFKQGYSVGTIQAILRHQNPNTTTIYLKTLGVEDVRGALDGLFVPTGSKMDWAVP